MKVLIAEDDWPVLYPHRRGMVEIEVPRSTHDRWEEVAEKFCEVQHEIRDAVEAAEKAKAKP